MSAAMLVHAGGTPATTVDLVSVYSLTALTSRGRNLVWRFVIPPAAVAKFYGYKTKA